MYVFLRTVPGARLTRQLLQAALTALAAGALMVSATACGSDNADTAGTSASSGEPAKPVAVARTPSEPFDPNLKAGLKPSLPMRFAQTLPAGGELFEGLDDTARDASKSFGFEYISSQADGDSPKQFQQTQGMLSRGLAALSVNDAAPPALRSLQLDAMKQGTLVIATANSHGIVQGNADQYTIGHAAGEAAVKWIDENLGGRAEVAFFNEDFSPAIKPRDDGVRDALGAGGSGIRIVADVPMRTLATDQAFKDTNTILQKHPDVDVWMGADGYLVGTLGALKAAGKADGDTALFGYGGDTQALAEIQKGGAFKYTQGWLSNLWAYAQVKYAHDWTEGKSVPLFVNNVLMPLDSPEAIEQFKDYQAHPEKAFARNEKTHEFLTEWGNTSYESPKYLTVVGTPPRS